MLIISVLTKEFNQDQRSRKEEKTVTKKCQHLILMAKKINLKDKIKNNWVIVEP
jgi:hypothetical protein